MGVTEPTVGQGLPADVLAWVEAEGGGVIVNATRQPGGARKQAWVIDLKRLDGTTAELFVRYDPGPATNPADPWTLHREAGVYLALQGRGVAVPRVLAVHPVHQAMLAERLRGENWFSRITDPAE
ncbi:MAG: aminoglycoside phosphotransferase, partial [Acidimicrobiia bacterium]|nr:aminoglycoside phosphotransferase [Acidimicrobiia bacterium]